MTRRISPAEAEAAYERGETVRYCAECEGTGTERAQGRSGQWHVVRCEECKGRGEVER